MPRYIVSVVATPSAAEFEVEADDEDEAVESALDDALEYFDFEVETVMEIDDNEVENSYLIA